MNKLEVDDDSLELHKHFLTEYKEQGSTYQMTEINGNEKQGMYFIPHIGVYHPDNNFTPL